MSHILITNRTGKTTRLHVGVVQWLLILIVLSAVTGSVFYYGMQYGSQEAEPDAMVSVMQKELNKYQRDLK